MSKSEVSSKQSKRSNVSKPLSKKSEVDETLFGSTKNKANPAERQKQEELQKIKQKVLNNDLTHPEVVLIPESELIRMKNLATITTKEEQFQQKKILEEQKEKQQAAAKAKKDKMLKLEAEKKKQVPLSDLQKREKEVKDSLLTRAQEILDEQIDEVKDMNKMMMYAKCVTVRDKQLDEKRQVHDVFKEQEKRKDLMSEIERLKKIKHYQDQERMKKEELRQGHLKIIDQIKERELLRLREKEAQELEGQFILKEIAQHQKDEQEFAIKRKIEQKKLLDTIAEANQKAILVKQKRSQDEKDEEEKIVAYNQAKLQKEKEFQAEQKRVKEEKEREVQRLRELQEKAQDRQAELDALRAKRAMEQNERNERERERREAEFKKKINDELQDARKQQTMEKQQRLQEQAILERDEFHLIIQAQKQEHDLELKLEQEKQELVKKHAEELRKQIAMNEESTKQQERDKLEQGKKIKDNQIKYQQKLEQIKDKKLTELKGSNIQEKYMAELSRKKIA